MTQLRKTLELGSSVIVSAKGGWQADSLGFIVDGPEPVNTLQGEDYFYWVKFMTPQRDQDNDGPYSKAQILSRYLTIEV